MSVIRYLGGPMLKITCFAAATVFAAPVLADTHIAYTDAAGQPGMQLYVKDGKVRMENGAGQPIGIFDTVNPALLVLIPVQKQYAMFDDKTAAHLGAEYQEAQKQLEEATKKLQDKAETMTDKLTTVAQHGLLQTLVGHALVDYMVRLMIPSGFSMQVELKPLDTSQTVAGFACQDEQVIINGNPGETRCVAHDLATLGIPAADLTALQTMSDDYKQILTAIEPMAPGLSKTFPTGLPVKSQKMTYDMATHKLGSRTDTLQGISAAPLAASLFTPPADYAQVSLDALSAGGR